MEYLHGLIRYSSGITIQEKVLEILQWFYILCLLPNNLLLTFYEEYKLMTPEKKRQSYFSGVIKRMKKKLIFRILRK